MDKNTALAIKSTIYENSPIDINEQLELLKTRGLIIDNHILAQRFLKEVYFYRFLSYSMPFTQSGNLHYYKPNTTFTDVIKTYEFDSNLRNLLLESIEKIEISLRTHFIALSWKYGPHFYLNRKLFRDNRILKESIERIQFQINVSQDLLASKYYHKYSEPNMPPIWVILEFISVGQLSKWILNLRNEQDRNEIASHYNIHYNVLQATLDNLTLIRNYAAHHNRIWNRDFSIKNINKHLITHFGPELISDERIYNILILIAWMLKSIKIEKKFFNKLLNMVERYNVNIALMGFPSNWKENFKKL